MTSEVLQGAGNLMDEMTSTTASAEEKTNFFIQYLMNQREPLLHFGQTLLLAIVVFLVGRKIIKLLLKLADRGLKKSEMDASAYRFLHSVLNVLLTLVLVFIVAGIVGVGTSSIVAIIGSAGLTIGLALQGSLANFAGGVLILMTRPFRAGDYIITPSGEGSVQSIDIFYTHLRSTDNKLIVIPNGSLTNGTITNTSSESKRLLMMDFMVPARTDTSQVRSLLLKMMAADEKADHSQEMAVVVDRLYPGRIKMVAKVWVANEDYWDVRYRMLEQIKMTLEEHDIFLE